MRGYADRVVISCGSEVIARHPRSYERDSFVYDPIHFLPLLEQNAGTLEQAAPLQGWDLPDEFAALRRLPESRMGRRGKREYGQVFRLLETLSQQEVHAAVRDAIRLGELSFDAVNTWCCAGWRCGRDGWIWRSTPTCPESGPAPLPLGTT